MYVWEKTIYREFGIIHVSGVHCGSCNISPVGKRGTPVHITIEYNVSMKKNELEVYPFPRRMFMMHFKKEHKWRNNVHSMSPFWGGGSTQRKIHMYVCLLVFLHVHMMVNKDIFNTEN